MLNITNVGAFTGGDAFLIESPDGKNAIVDAGYACGAAITVEKIRKALNGRPLDYILLTHSHYDHTSASPALAEAWPGAQIVASEYAAYVFTRPGARREMRRLNESAAEQWEVAPNGELIDRLHVDRTVADGDVLDLGSYTLRVLAAPGHTRDTIGFWSEEEKLLIGNETYGTFSGCGHVMPAYLVGYQMTIDSIDRAAALGARTIIIPHWGVITGETCDGFFAEARHYAESTRNLIVNGWREGLSRAQLVDRYRSEYYVGCQMLYQPEPAFMTNANHIVNMILRECCGVTE